MRNQRDGARILIAPLDGFAVRCGDLDDLDAAREGRRANDLLAQLRVGETEHGQQRRVARQIAGRSLRVETEPVAIERDRLLEVGRDGAEVIAHAHDEAGRSGPGRRRRDRRLSVQIDRAERERQQRKRGRCGSDHESSPSVRRR